MANVKHNEDVKNKQDLQNLVTGIIFRQCKSFKKYDVIQTINYYLKGSEFYDNISLIKEYVTDTLNLLQSRDVVRCRNGSYSVRNPLIGSFPD